MVNSVCFAYQTLTSDTNELNYQHFHLVCLFFFSVITFKTDVYGRVFRLFSLNFLQGHKVFAWYDGKLSAADYYVGRVNLLDNAYGYGRASVNLTSIRETDSGWYELKMEYAICTNEVVGVFFAHAHFLAQKIWKFNSMYKFNGFAGMNVESFSQIERPALAIMERGFIWPWKVVHLLKYHRLIKR